MYYQVKYDQGVTGETQTAREFNISSTAGQDDLDRAMAAIVSLLPMVTFILDNGTIVRNTIKEVITKE